MGNSANSRQGERLEVQKLHTPSHVNCPVCENSKMLAVQEAHISHFPFVRAAEIWLEQHRLYISQRTYSDYQEHLRRLDSFFGDILLDQIHIGHLREYQKLRMQSVGNEKINKELSTLQQVLKEAKLWEPLNAFYRPLPVDREGAGKSLTPEQERVLLWACDEALEPCKLKPGKKKRGRPRAQLAANCVKVILRFGRGLGELKKLRRKDVDLEREVIHWPATKTKAREQSIPIPKNALEPLCWLVARWEDLGGSKPDDFLLPGLERKTNRLDFRKPIGSIKRGWATILEIANKELKRLELPLIDENFRLYDLRPHTISKALGSGKVSIHTAMKLFGHVSDAMQKRYYKPQLETLRDAIESINE